MISNLIICFGAVLACIAGIIFMKPDGIFIVGAVVFAFIGITVLWTGRKE